MFNKKITKRIIEVEAKSDTGYSAWGALATILALGVIGPLFVLLWNKYTLIVIAALITY